MDELKAYKAHLHEMGKLDSALALLAWDQRTYLPRKGQETRAEAIGKLTKLSFQMATSPRLGRLLDALGARDGLSLGDRASLRVVGKDYGRRKAIPARVVERFAIARSKSETAWERAKETSDFKAFLPHLEGMVDFSRRFADYYGYKESPYDALIEDYEPGMTARELRTIIRPLREDLVPFIRHLTAEGRRPDTDVLSGHFPVEAQRDLALRALRAIGYDFDAGRLDTSVHPFTIAIGPGDARVTTRFLDTQVLSNLFSSLHEGGHALYDQGIPEALRWSGLDQAASFGIHESQSRTWENCVGRSRTFWVFFQPILAEVFPQFRSVSAEALFRAANVVEPSLIRVEADEVTYSLHIMLRFEIEEGLINGTTQARDLPDLWREAMREYLGVVPKTDAEGVLQDVHWSAGLFGYFPSYMLGNLYGAQIYAKAKEEIPDLEEGFARGDFAPLLRFLREKIHQDGRTYEPKDLVRRATGEEPDSRYFVRYVKEKYGEVYGLR